MTIRLIRRENVRALAKSVGGISKLALMLGKSQSQLSHVIGRSPIKNIGDKLAAYVEVTFGKPAGWLDKEHYEIENIPTVYSTTQGTSAIYCPQVPLITWEDAGKWHQLGYGYQPKTCQEWIGVPVPVGELAFAVRVKDDTMEAAYGLSFPKGATVIADPDEIATQDSFIVVSSEPSREATLKQLVSDGNKSYLKALNPHYPLLEKTVSTLIHAVVKQVTFTFS